MGWAPAGDCQTESITTTNTNQDLLEAKPIISLYIPCIYLLRILARSDDEDSLDDLGSSLKKILLLAAIAALTRHQLVYLCWSALMTGILLFLFDNNQKPVCLHIRL